MAYSKVLQLTDLHLFGDPDRGLRRIDTAATLARVLADVRAAHWPADAILLTGDLVHDESRAGYLRLREHFAPFGVPIYCIPGNHDDPRLMQELLDCEPFQCGGSARLGHWGLALLDTHATGVDHGELSAESLTALEHVLRDHAGRPTLVCLHHHPVAVGSAWLDALALANPQDLFEVLDRHPQVRALLCGHVHQVFHEDLGGRSFMSTPSTCVQFRPHSDEMVLDSRPPAYRWLALHDDGRLETEVVWVEAR